MQIDLSKLQGRYVYLETLTPEYMGVLKRLARDKRLWEYTKTLLINDTFDEQFQTYMQTAFDERATGGQHSFVIRQTSDNAIIGMTRFYKIEQAHKRLSIGFTWYIPDVWGKVHNKECKLLLLQYAFEEARFQRVEFEVAHQNIRSQKAVLKIGGTQEGRLRKHGLHADGTVRDTIVFSIIDDEWPEKKTALQKLVQQGTENE